MANWCTLLLMIVTVISTIISKIHIIDFIFVTWLYSDLELILEDLKDAPPRETG